MSVCMSAVSARTSEVLIKYTGKYVKIYFNMKITFLHGYHADTDSLVIFSLMYCVARFQ